MRTAAIVNDSASTFAVKARGGRVAYTNVYKDVLDGLAEMLPKIVR
jgi:hypothetical protein